MFFFRHPKPVGDNRAVAMKIVEQKMTDEFNPKVIVLNDKALMNNKNVPAQDTDAASNSDDVTRHL